MYQDNNGLVLLPKQTRHANCQFFLVAKGIKKGELEVHHYPTDIIIGNFITKPLQGKNFLDIRCIIMNEHL